LSDIFISYAKEDRERARVLAEALEGLGWSVWWDRIIPTGRVFARVIKEEIDAAKCVVVLWSSNSVLSEWVEREARRAKEQEKLFPALIGEVQPPWEFEELQACDLVDWDGKSTTGNFPLLVGDMGRILGIPPGQVEEQRRRQEEEEAEHRAQEEAKKRAEEEENHRQARDKKAEEEALRKAEEQDRLRAEAKRLADQEKAERKRKADEARATEEKVQEEALEGDWLQEYLDQHGRLPPGHYPAGLPPLWRFLGGGIILGGLVGFFVSGILMDGGGPGMVGGAIIGGLGMFILWARLKGKEQPK